MIKKLYEIGCFDYKKFILDYNKSLGLTSDETLVLIVILENYEHNKSLSNEILREKLSLTKTKIDKALSSLMERSFYEIYINYDQGTGEEYISLDCLFSKIENILENKPSNSQDELYLVTQYVTQEMNRILTSKELEIISSLVTEDKYSYEAIQKAIERIKQKKKLLSMRSLVQTLSLKEEETPSKPKTKIMKDFFDSIK